MPRLLPVKKPSAITRPLALTMGDPAGIGPEITIKVWRKLRSDPNNGFFVIADPALYEGARTIETPDQASGIFKTALPVLPIKCAEVITGRPNKNTAPAILNSIKSATTLALSNEVSGIVTNPIAKEILYRSGFSFPGHTEFLAELTKSTKTPYSQGPVMMLSSQGLRVALVTIHMPLKDVANAISIDRIVHTARVLHGALRIDLGISSPRIAMAGLNPHAGENGSLGHEENDILIPAAETLRAEGINIGNPRSADTLFHKEARAEYDAVLAMYHDQGLIPVKSLDFYGGVNTTLGLPIIRTSPDHGTAFEIAGNGVAREDSLLAAIELARNMAANRCKYSETGHG